MIRRLVPSWTAFFRVNAHESMEPFEPQSVLIGIVSVGNSPAQREREGGEERQNRIGDDLGGCFLACRNPFEKDLIPFERTLIPMRVLCDSSSQLASRRRRLGSKRTARKRLAESAGLRHKYDNAHPSALGRCEGSNDHGLCSASSPSLARPCSRPSRGFPHPKIESSIGKSSA